MEKFIKSEVLLKLIKVGNFLILLLPFFIWPKMIFPYVFPKAIVFQVIVEILLLAYLALILWYPKFFPKMTLVAKSVIFFVCSYGVSTILSVDRLVSFWGDVQWENGLFLILHLTVFFFILSATATEKDWKFYLQTAVGAGFIISLSGLLHLAGLIFPKPIDLRIYGLLGNPTFLSSYLIFYLFIICLSWSKEKDINWRIFLAFNFIIGLIIFFFSQTRGAYLGLAAGIFVSFLLYVLFYSPKKYRRWLICGLTALLIFLVFSSVFLISQYKNDLNRQRNIQTRLISWQVSWQAWQDKFLFGWGPENFYPAFNRYFNPQYLTYSTVGGLNYEAALNFCHNKIIDTGLAQGIFGVLSYLAIFAAAFWRLFKTRKTGREFIVIGGLLTAYFVNNLFLFDFIISFLMFYFVLAYIDSTFDNVESKNFQWPVNSIVKIMVWLIFAAIVSAILIVGNFKPWRAGSLLNQAYENNQKFKIEKSIDNYQRAFALDTYLNLNACQDLEALAAQVINANAENQKARDFYDFTGRALESCLADHPWRLSAYLQLAEFYNAGRIFDEEKIYQSEEILNRALLIAPDRPETYLHLGQTKIYQEQKNTAIEYFKKATALNEDFYVTFLIFGRAYLYYDMLDEAYLEYEKAIDSGYTGKLEIEETAKFYLDEKDLTKARKYYEKLQKLYPSEKYREILENLSKSE